MEKISNFIENYNKNININEENIYKKNLIISKIIISELLEEKKEYENKINELKLINKNIEKELNDSLNSLKLIHNDYKILTEKFSEFKEKKKIEKNTLIENEKLKSQISLLNSKNSDLENNIKLLQNELENQKILNKNFNEKIDLNINEKNKNFENLNENYKRIIKEFKKLQNDYNLVNNQKISLENIIKKFCPNNLILSIVDLNNDILNLEYKKFDFNEDSEKIDNKINEYKNNLKSLENELNKENNYIFSISQNSNFFNNKINDIKNKEINLTDSLTLYEYN